MTSTSRSPHKGISKNRTPLCVQSMYTTLILSSTLTLPPVNHSLAPPVVKPCCFAFGAGGGTDTGGGLTTSNSTTAQPYSLHSLWAWSPNPRRLAKSPALSSPSSDLMSVKYTPVAPGGAKVGGENGRPIARAAMYCRHGQNIRFHQTMPGITLYPFGGGGVDAGDTGFR